MSKRVVGTKHFDIAGRDVPRTLFPSGRLRISIGRVKESEAEARRAELKKLRTWGAWDVLRAVADGMLHVANVIQRVKASGEVGLAEIRREIEAHRIGLTPTVAEEIERYLEWYETHRRARSLRQTKSRLKRFGEQTREDGTLLRDLRMDQVMKSDIERAMAAISSNSSTQEGIRLAVSGLFTWSMEDESEAARVAKRSVRWHVNPSSKVTTGERNVRVVTVADSQMLKLLAASEIYQEAYLRCYAQFGLRRNELTHTRLHDDLDVRDWVWRMQPRGPDERCGCPDCQSEGWRPKSKRGVRTLLVPKDHPIRAAVTRYLELHPCEPGDFVFRNPRTGTIWEESRIEADFKRLCERAEIRYGIAGNGITIHALRHTCATEMIRNGVRESVVAGQLGDTVDTIVKTYVHLKKEDLAAGVSMGPRYQV